MLDLPQQRIGMHHSLGQALRRSQPASSAYYDPAQHESQLSKWFRSSVQPDPETQPAAMFADLAPEQQYVLYFMVPSIMTR